MLLSNCEFLIKKKKTPQRWLYFSYGLKSIYTNEYILFTHQQMHFLLNLEKFKITWKYT